MHHVCRYYIETTPRGLDALGYSARGHRVINVIRGDAHTSIHSLIKSVRKHWPHAKRLKRKPKARETGGIF